MNKSKGASSVEAFFGDLDDRYPVSNEPAYSDPSILDLVREEREKEERHMGDKKQGGFDLYEYAVAQLNRQS